MCKLVYVDFTLTAPLALYVVEALALSPSLAMVDEALPLIPLTVGLIDDAANDAQPILQIMLNATPNARILFPNFFIIDSPIIIDN
jgi:hypothetical protein